MRVQSAYDNTMEQDLKLLSWRYYFVDPRAAAILTFSESALDRAVDAVMQPSPVFDSVPAIIRGER